MNMALCFLAACWFAVGNEGARAYEAMCSSTLIAVKTEWVVPVLWFSTGNGLHTYKILNSSVLHVIHWPSSLNKPNSNCFFKMAVVLLESKLVSILRPLYLTNWWSALFLAPPTGPCLVRFLLGCCMIGNIICYLACQTALLRSGDLPHTQTLFHDVFSNLTRPQPK